MNLTIRDEGKSGWKGEHLKTGNLGKFLKRIKDEGEIPEGSVLYVEAVDRLTRLEFTDAMNLILGQRKEVKGGRHHLIDAMRRPRLFRQAFSDVFVEGGIARLLAGIRKAEGLN
jgi:hypothetical protein